MASPPKYTDSPVKSYGSSNSAEEAAQPLLAAQASSSRGNAWMDQPADDDLPDDFKYVSFPYTVISVSLGREHTDKRTESE